MDGLKELVPMTFSLLGFVLFCFIFSTVPNPRYTDIVPLCGYIYLAYITLMLSKHGKKMFSIIMASLLMLIVLTSSFYSFDPISNRLYLKEGGSENQLYTVDNKTPFYGDGSVYNKQGLFMEGSYNRALRDAIQNDMQLLISGNEEEAYFLDGMLGKVTVDSGEYEFREGYFDTKKGIRKIHSGDNTITYSVGIVNDLGSIKSISATDRYIYVYCDEIGKKLADDIIANVDIVEKKEYSYMGVKLHGIVFEYD